eukprot:11624399-Ditylum_brightwellii.AAC.1
MVSLAPEKRLPAAVADCCVKQARTKYTQLREMIFRFFGSCGFEQMGYVLLHLIDVMLTEEEGLECMLK